MQQQLSYRPAPVTNKVADQAPAKQEVKTPAPQAALARKKLSYKEQQELAALPAQLEQLEQAIEALQEKVNEPDFFSQADNDTQAVLQQLADAEAQLEMAFNRWEELEAVQ